MPLFDYHADDENFVGLRDGLGRIVRWPTHDAFGNKLDGHNFKAFRHLDDTHFVVAKEEQFKPDMVFKLIEEKPMAISFETNFEPNDAVAPAAIKKAVDEPVKPPEDLAPVPPPVDLEPHDEDELPPDGKGEEPKPPVPDEPAKSTSKKRN